MKKPTTAGNPFPQVVKPEPLVVSVTLPNVHVFSGWSDEKITPTRIRAAQDAQGSSSRLDYIGVRAAVAIPRLKRDPTRTFVHDIEDALQDHNRLPLLNVVRLYAYADLYAHAGFASLIQSLQGHARAGDTWAKETLTKYGEALGARGKGKTPTLSTEARSTHRHEQNRAHGKKRNLRKAAERLFRKIEQQEAWLLEEHRKTPTEARKEACTLVVQEWKETSPARNKSAILARLQELLDGR